MTMKNNKKSHPKILPLLGLIALVATLLFIGVLKIKGAKERYCLVQTHLQFSMDEPMDGDKWDFYSNCYNQLTLSDAGKILLGSRSKELKKAQRITELNATMTKNPNKDSQEYKAARQEFCLLTARPAGDREMAVANIQKFLGKPDVPVEFLCSRLDSLPNDTGTDYNSPASEHYEAARFSFTVDPNTNYIVEVGQGESRWGYNDDGSRWFDPLPEYDHTARYTSPEEIKPVAEQFMKNHEDILGVDISQMTYEYRGTKPGNYFVQWVDYEHPFTEEYEQCGDVDRDLEGVYQKENGAWCAPIKNTRYPTVSLTITQGGQVIIYDNDGWEIEKL